MGDYKLSCSGTKGNRGNGDSIDDSVEEKRAPSAVEKIILDKIEKKGIKLYDKREKGPDTDGMLLVMRDELYGRSWERMKKDIKNRVNGKPYIFKLVNQMKYDLERINILEKFENKYKINLKNYLLFN